MEKRTVKRKILTHNIQLEDNYQLDLVTIIDNKKLVETRLMVNGIYCSDLVKITNPKVFKGVTSAFQEILKELK